ncbi:MAG: methyltransferase domain-containing protein [Deltaproteobacteria bacterium]|nr:methyltransferase domain-containing protein [Deltaproteobacteria bacterium]
MNELTALLAVGDPLARRLALAELRKKPAPKEDHEVAFYDALGDENFSVRRDVVRLLQTWQDTPGLLPALERALCDEENLGRRSAAMEAFGRIQAKAIPTLKRLFESPSDGIRRLVVDSLGITQVKEAFPLLELATEDESSAVRCAAAEALTRIDPKRSTGVLERLLRSQQNSSVMLAVLLAAEGAKITLPESCLRLHLQDSLTTPPTLRLLGRQGCIEPVLERFIVDRGARQRAALVGLALSYDVTPVKTSKAVKARSTTQVREAAKKWLGSRDVAVASAALLVLALIGDSQALVEVAERQNPHELAAGCYRALTILSPSTGWMKKAEEQASTAAARDFLKMIGGVEASEPQKSPPQKHRMSLSDETFKALSGLFERDAGLNFEAHSAYRLEARLLVRVKELGFSDFESYVAFLNSHSLEAQKELREAIAQVTVHETYFFRERPQLDAFMKEVLPALLEDRKEIRVWSAGCSTGEEAYTLAVLLEEYARTVRPFDFKIIGTDISSRVLEKAKKAVYNRRSFRSETPADLLERYFVKVDKDHVEVRPELRQKVKCRAGNLMKDSPTAFGQNFDVVFCRNVLIYFSKSAREKVVERFFSRIQPGGVLLLGHSESLFSVDTQFELVPLSREMIYARPNHAGQVLAPKNGWRAK